MSISENISYSPLNNLGLPLQESSSWTGKVITKVRTTASCLVSSIGSVAQSILSNFIYVGTLGRYTLDDLKDYFSTKVSIENRNIEEKSVGEADNALKEAKSRLKRHDSKVSVSSTLFRKLCQSSSNSQDQSIYPNLGGEVKVSTYAKTPEQRLAEMEKIAMEKTVTNQGK